MTGFAPDESEEQARPDGEAVGPLLSIEGLRTEFRTDGHTFAAVDDVSLAIGHGQTLGIVGESGCGKSVTALSVMGLVQAPGRIAGGRILLDGEDLLAKSERELRRIRGNRIAMIFQEPMTSLNPVFTVGDQLGEAVRLHQKKSRAEARERAIELLKLVGIPSPETRVDAYPHELSGGMRQRVMIAMALACDPELLIADEPTTALDVTIQAQILALLRKLQRERGLAVMLITHDLGVVAESCEQVAVMYAGKVVERSSAAALFAAPRHPYTAGLLRSLPGAAGAAGRGKGTRLEAIPGVVPAPDRMPAGCRFRDRCDRAVPACAREIPPLVALGQGREVACFNPVPEAA
ncbi:ABC transporter ATP-binding protein [Vulgatibacter incomptus]|uniref:Oligopeptide transport ATP-binding protein OppD n=1 Tax=Vulgatibacter incomptus TaxID=1391653 RepID=A0A0K1PBZ4_9BACT|nr:ABC transporter ATP-binding protein [Vulgatibacter incomptus]AKU91058.1 Oligopeptide transport ATP-binding protein OppD [Vulgatibacter incomptus]